MINIGWRLIGISVAGVETVLRPRVGGTLSQDLSGTARRTLTGLSFGPDQAAEVDLVADTVRVELVEDGVTLPMGEFKAATDVLNCDAVMDTTGNVADVRHADFGDLFLLLNRSDERPRTLLAGSDPAQEMRALLRDAGLPHAIGSASSSLRESSVWAAFTTWEAMISQLAELAGHRRPWMDNAGVIRSVEANVAVTNPVDLADLRPVAGTITIGNNYLSAPNRYVVQGDGEVPAVGVWNAPSSAPHSELNRGYVLTAGTVAQGIAGAVHAQQMAATIGESLTARKLDATIVPTDRLDGPTVIAFRDALWLCENWSVGLEVGGMMTISATELP